jgi:inosose dehydratase
VSVNAWRVANAPCNFGVYSLDAPVIEPDEMLARLAAQGYDGVDSGPIGYFGTGAELAGRLARHGMGLAGGWVDLRFADADGFAADLSTLDTALDAFTAVPVDDPRYAPRPTLALAGFPPRVAQPGRPSVPGLPDDQWPDFAARVQQAADRCRDRGLEPVFHYHLGTLVETPAEADRLLELTDISICLDTGHLTLAGGDPVAAAEKWGHRIRQVHIKDADLAVHDRGRAAGRDFAEIVADGGFPAAGHGTVDIPGVLAVLDRLGYAGWLVVEQDAPATGQDVERILRDQAANRAQLREHGV